MDKEIIRASRILIVDDQPANVTLLKQALQTAGYLYMVGVTDSRETLRAFSDFQPDLVVIDLRMPHVDGFALLKQLRSRVPASNFLPVLVLTADNSRKAKQEALALGAKDFLTKPIDIAEALLRIYNLLETRWLYNELHQYSQTLEEKVRQRTAELEQAQLEILRRLALAAEYRDDCTGQHTHRVGEWAALLSRAIGLPEDEVELIRRAAPLHDVGKIGVPDGILLKPAKLTPEEYEQVKRHTEIGRTILSGSQFAMLQMAERIAFYHHERWDGSGYYGLKGKEIPLEARIVSIVDVFDVIIHERPYKAASGIDVAVEAIREGSGKHFDPAIANAFLELNSKLDLVQLDGALADRHEAVAGLVVGDLKS